MGREKRRRVYHSWNKRIYSETNRVFSCCSIVCPLVVLLCWPRSLYAGSAFAASIFTPPKIMVDSCAVNVVPVLHSPMCQRNLASWTLNERRVFIYPWCNIESTVSTSLSVARSDTSTKKKCVIILPLRIANQLPVLVGNSVLHTWGRRNSSPTYY